MVSWLCNSNGFQSSNSGHRPCDDHQAAGALPTGRMVPTVPPPKRYRIGEVVRHSGLSRQTVHNYTVMGLICESEWTAGGHRLYDADVFERLALIKDLKGRYRLREVKRILDHGRDGSYSP